MWLIPPTTLGQIVSVSHEGKQYFVADGVVEVPDTAKILLEMGFTQTGPPTPKAKAGPEKPSGGNEPLAATKPKPLIRPKG